VGHGTTYLRNAASEPHVQDLAHFLVALGADRGIAPTPSSCNRHARLT
jgi:UDP-N-acetylglucosamine enolpyruvyl transferase